MPYREINDPVTLRRLLEATLLIEANLELPALLSHLIDEARSMTGAAYGALGVLNEERTALAEFLTVGLDPDAERKSALARPARGCSASSSLTPSRCGWRRSAPTPTATAFRRGTAHDLVPRRADQGPRRGLWPSVSHRQGRVVRVHPRRPSADRGSCRRRGIAIENARLHERVRAVAVYEDRDRLARDLHDTVIQRLFAIGLGLQSIAGTAPPAVSSDCLLGDLDVTIRQIRSTIYELGLDDTDRGVRAASSNSWPS